MLVPMYFTLRKEKHIMKKVLTSLLIALLVLACAGCGTDADDAGKTSPGARVDANDADKGDNTASTMRLEKSEGSVSVSDENGKEQEAREKLPLFNGYEMQPLFQYHGAAGG